MTDGPRPTPVTQPKGLAGVEKDAAFVEELGELVGAFEGGEDEGLRFLLGVGVGVEALEDEVAEGRVGHYLFYYPFLTGGSASSRPSRPRPVTGDRDRSLGLEVPS